MNVNNIITDKQRFSWLLLLYIHISKLELHTFDDIANILDKEQTEIAITTKKF